MSYLLFAGCPNTKFFLEDAFSHMADVSSRFARHFKMTKSLGDMQHRQQAYFISRSRLPAHDTLLCPASIMAVFVPQEMGSKSS